MILARFGEEYFYVSSEKGIYTVDGLSFEYGKEVETQGTTGYKPLSYITALKLINSGFKIHLDHRFVDIQQKIDKWKSMAEGNKHYAFSVAGKFISENHFVVLTSKVSNVKINGKGKMLSADLDISVQEYSGTKDHDTIGILKKRLEDYA